MADSWDRICQACSAGDLETFSTILASGSCFYDTNLLGAGDLGSYSKDPRRSSDIDRLSQLITLGCNKEEPRVNILNHLFSYSSVKQFIAHGGSKLARSAIRSGSPKIVRLFLQTNPAIANMAFTSFGPNALLCALHLNQRLCLPVVKVLLEYGADPSRPTHIGTLMAKACAVQTPEVVEALEEAGGRYNPRIGKMQLISAAAGEGNEAMVKYYLSKGVDLNLAYSIGNTITKGPPLWSATEKRRVKTVKLLLEAGADPSAPNYQGESAIQAAERNGFDDIFELLNNAAASRENDKASTSTLVFRATTKDHLDDNERALGGDLNIVKSSTTDE
jgi:ankyrin repeat protein